MKIQQRRSNKSNKMRKESVSLAQKLRRYKRKQHWHLFSNQPGWFHANDCQTILIRMAGFVLTSAFLRGCCFGAALAWVFTKSPLVTLCGFSHMLFNCIETVCPRELWVLFCASYQEETTGRLSCLFLMRKASYNRNLCCISSLWFLMCT